MKSRRILAAVLAPVCAVSATAAVAVAEKEISGDVGMSGAVSCTYDSTYDVWTWSFNLAYAGVLDGVDVNEVCGAKIVFTEAIIEDSAATGIGGAFAVGSDSHSWDSIEWGNAGADKEITLDATTHSITRIDENPFFDEADTYMNISLQVSWGPDVEIESLSLLDKDGNVLKTFAAEAEDDNSGSGEGETDEGVVIYDTPAAFGEWNYIQINDNDTLKGATAGSKIVVALEYEPDTYYKIGFCSVGEEWSRLTGMANVSGYDSENDDILISGTPETFTYILTAEDAEAISNGYIVIFGSNITVNSVTFFSASEGGDNEGEGGGDNGGGDTTITPPIMPSPDTSKDDNSSDTSPSKPAPDANADITAEVKGVDTQKGVEGKALNDVVLVKDGKRYTWNDVESVTFTSDKLFSVAFSTTEELAGTTWFTMGKDKVPASRAGEDGVWSTSWTLGAAELALFDTSKDDNGYVKVIAKEDGTDISVSVNLRATADAPSDGDNSSTDSSDDNNTSKPAESGNNSTANPGNSGNNPATGIAIAVAPLAIAGAAAVVATSKKRK